MTTDREQFLKQFREFIEQHYRPGGLPAATLGNMWKAHAPDTNWQLLGFERMSDALYAITDQSESGWEILRRATPQMMLLRRGDAEASQRSATGKVASLAKRVWVPRLLEDVWLAFVNEVRWGKRFLNRRTGAVKMDVESAPDPVEDWMEVTPITQAEQQQWAQTFIAENDLAGRDDLRAAIEQPQWYLHFAHALRTTPALIAAWNGFRSRRVGEYVDAWCAANGVDVNLLRAPDRLATRETSSSTSPATALGAIARSQPKSELRQILVAAFARLHTHEMLQMHLPPHAVIAVLRPDLLD